MSLNGHWFVTLDGREHGPLSVRDLRALAEAGRIDGETPLSNDAIIGVLPAKRVSGVIGSAVETVVDEPAPIEPPPADRRTSAAEAASEPAAPTAATFFVRIDDREQGPFTGEQLKALADQQKITPDTRVRRQGIDGTASARRMPGLFSAEVLAAHQPRQGDGSSAERPAPRIAFFRLDDAGKEVGPFSADQLRKLARDGVVTPTSRLRRDGAEGTFSARRITGLFPPEVVAAYAKPGEARAAAAEPRMPDDLVSDEQDDIDTSELAARTGSGPVAKRPAPAPEDAADDDGGPADEDIAADADDEDDADGGEAKTDAAAQKKPKPTAPRRRGRGLFSFFRRSAKPAETDADDEDADDGQEEAKPTGPAAVRQPTVKAKPMPPAAAEKPADEGDDADDAADDGSDDAPAKPAPKAAKAEAAGSAASGRRPALHRPGKRPLGRRR